MAVRKFKPTTPGQRHKIIGTFEEITASVPEKSLVFGKLATGLVADDGEVEHGSQLRITAGYHNGNHVSGLNLNTAEIFYFFTAICL